MSGRELTDAELEIELASRPQAPRSDTFPGDCLPVRTGWYWGEIERDVIGNPGRSGVIYWDGADWFKVIGWATKNQKERRPFKVHPDGTLAVVPDALLEICTVLSWHGLSDDQGRSLGNTVRFSKNLDYRLCTGKYLVGNTVYDPERVAA